MGLFQLDTLRSNGPQAQSEIKGLIFFNFFLNFFLLYVTKINYLRILLLSNIVPSDSHIKYNFPRKS